MVSVFSKMNPSDVIQQVLSECLSTGIPQPLVGGLGSRRPGELRVDYQIIAEWRVSTPAEPWRQRAGRVLSPPRPQLMRGPRELDCCLCYVSHCCLLPPCAVAVMAPHPLSDWLHDPNGCFWQHHDNREEFSG